MKFSLFRYGTSVLYGAVLSLDSIAPDSGPSTGGKDFIIRGNAFIYPTYDDTFIGAVLDAVKWTDISSGTGAISVGSTHLQLSTGTTAGSVAGVESNGNFTNTQYESKVNIAPVTVLPTATVSLYTMQTYVDANNNASISVELDNEGNVTLNCRAYLGGSLKDEYTSAWTTGVSTFKILKWGTELYFYANGSLVYRSKQGSASSATFRYYVTNLTATYNVTGTVVEYVKNRPYVSFDDQVVHDLVVVSDTRARGLTPPSIDQKENLAAYEGLVDVSYVSYTTDTLSNAYDYFYVDSLTLIDEVQFDLKFSEIDDETVRTPSLSNRGLGGGK